MSIDQIVPTPETQAPCGSAQPAPDTLNISPTGPQEFDLLATEREAMQAAGIPSEMLPPLPAFTPEEGHRNAGGFGV